MKLCQLDLIAFGPFENVSLDLSQGDPGLHVIYGDNEDGKSTTLRAIRGLLFGIEERTNDDHHFKKAQLRVGGRLRGRSGDEQAFVRRKGRKDTLRHPDSDEPLAANALDPFLGGLSEHVFTRLYGIDYQELVTGSKGILDEKGELGKALYAAATGTASLKKLSDEMEQEAAKLFKPRASTSRIYAAVNEHKTRLKEAKEASLSSSNWTKLHRESDEVTRAREALDDERRTHKKELAQQERVKRVRPALAQRTELQTALEEMGEVVDLPEDFEQSRRDAADLKRSAQERLMQIAAKVEQLKAEEAGAQLPTAVLEHAVTIELLQRKFGYYEKAQVDRPAQDAKRRQHTNDARGLLKAVRPDLGVKEVENMRPLLALKQSIQTLVSQHEQLAVEEQQAERTLRETRDKATRLLEERDQVKEDRDPAKLAAAVNEAQRAGDLDAQAQNAHERYERRQEQCRLELSRLGLWQGTGEELERAPLPSTEAVEQFETRFQGAGRRAQVLTDKLHELGEHREEVEEKITILEHSGQVPTTQELVSSRAHRDQGWGLVRRQCFDREDVEEEVQRYTNERRLPEVYEDAVRDADDVVDHLRSDADRVQQRDLFEAELSKAKRRLATLQVEQKEHGSLQDALQEEWQQVWAPVGLLPQSPREMAIWLRKAEALRQHLEELRSCQRDRDAFMKRRGGLYEILGAELEALGEAPSNLPNDLLGPLLERALQVLERLNQGRARERELGKAVQEAKAAQTRAEDEDGALQGRRAGWQREWAEIIRDFNFLSEPGVARIVATLEQLEALFKAVDKAEDLQHRVYGIDKVLSDFEAEVDRFAEIMGQPRADQPVEQYVVGLSGSLTTARKIETQLKGLRHQQEGLGSEEVELRAKVRTTDARLAELRSLARVDSDDALIGAGQRSVRTRELRSQIALREQQILDAGDGHSIKELRAQAQGVDGAELEDKIAQLSEALGVVEQQHSDALQREAELRQQIAAESGTANAADATEQAEQALSQLREDVRTYLRLRAATLILKDQIESYRQENQAPVLRRAGDLFTKLTLGSFAGLRDELDRSGRPILLGVRPDNQEVTVEGMSDGTRDQLYLALRLATLEQHLAAGEPIPFVVDDILMGFDDKRTEACLQVFAELAARTQVLLFTHHRRIAEIASSMSGNSSAIVCEMSS